MLGSNIAISCHQRNIAFALCRFETEPKDFVMYCWLRCGRGGGGGVLPNILTRFIASLSSPRSLPRRSKLSQGSSNSCWVAEGYSERPTVLPNSSLEGALVSYINSNTFQNIPGTRVVRSGALQFHSSLCMLYQVSHDVLYTGIPGTAQITNKKKPTAKDLRAAFLYRPPPCSRGNDPIVKLRATKF